MIQVIQVRHEHLARLQELWRADWLETHPEDTEGAAEAVARIQQTRDHHDFLRSDLFWLLATQVDGCFVGYLTVARVPKVDNHLFLFIDELFVLRRFRRQGVATALLHAVLDLGTNLSAKGIRLIVDAENTAARHLYRASGFTEGEQIFCQLSLR